MDIFENHIESNYRELDGKIDITFLDLYTDIKNQKLKEIFSTLHYEFIQAFKIMNERLPTGSAEAHFWADPSRALIKAIKIAENLQRGLKNSKYSFSITEYYAGLIKKCNEFLQRSGGSSIPPFMEKNELYYTLPIFIFKNTITIQTPSEVKLLDLKLIGEGSYAHVYQFRDNFYNKRFALKRAKKDLEPKELMRFKEEFEQMKKLDSPYIVEVFCYNDVNNEYIMEYMDFSLKEYIEKNNTKLTWAQRKGFLSQILRAFSYISSKNFFIETSVLKTS